MPELTFKSEEDRAAFFKLVDHAVDSKRQGPLDDHEERMALDVLAQLDESDIDRALYMLCPSCAQPK